jgi:hypothetical protein
MEEFSDKITNGGNQRQQYKRKIIKQKMMIIDSDLLAKGNQDR